MTEAEAAASEKGLRCEETEGLNAWRIGRR